ncbi:diheme cytochrome c [Phaeovulum sp.]|uniref:diheme cytochrome c n=1 Tax=Phaeovulum sp. TaxID=2934796 RepID=UPI00272FD4FF|nr:diheme cytochrome c [Phaeovulum sp.]MDP1669739.1 diheme cytochrome c [Phaeovulum sp.]MDP2063245.1 diheme cytochrome c [Phaeovulum sp.]MDZ4119027.1 diheme cytochrome c [Phaeovulum sp.]
MNRFIAPLAFALATLPLAAAAQDKMTPVNDPTTLTDCTECHMAFPAGFLPARSWEAVMAGLKDHFGENATISEANRLTITAYLVANATDSGAVSARTASRILRNVTDSMTPLRISDLPWWKNEHDGEVSKAEWERAKSPANCAACHRDAARGYFED